MRILPFLWLLAVLLVPGARAQGTAVLMDSAEFYGPSSGIFFVALSVDDQPLASNAIDAMRRATFGRGAYMKIVETGRNVPAGKVRLGIKASIENAAPIQSIFRAMFRGGSPEFTGTLSVELEAGKRYRVTGVLDDFKREAWVEEMPSRRIVSDKITMPVDPELAKLMEGAQFLCCNLRYDGNWSDDTPNAELAFIPAGTRIKVVDYSRNEASALVHGKRLRIGNQYSREKVSIRQLVEALVVAEDPRAKLDTWDVRVREAVRAARVMPGMTREQVIMALGRPRPAETPRLDVDEWLYHVGYEEAFVMFGPDGLVKALDASRKARGFLLFVQEPAPAAAPAAAPSTPAAAPAGGPAAAAAVAAPVPAAVATPVAAAASAPR